MASGSGATVKEPVPIVSAGMSVCVRVTSTEYVPAASLPAETSRFQGVTAAVQGPEKPE